MKFTLRPIEIVQLPVSTDLILCEPEKVVLRFDSEISFDVGSICYRNRSKILPYNNNLPSKSIKLVDINSYEVNRRRHVRKIIEFCNNEISLAAKRAKTVASDIYNLSRFLSWADKNNHQFPLSNKDTAHSVFSSYISYLRERIRHGKITQNTAAMSQFRILHALSEILETDKLSHGINLIRIKKYARQPTIPPTEEDQSRVISLCQYLFDGLSDFVINKSLYPYNISVPEYLGADNNTLWIFPTNMWCMPPHILKNRETLKYGHWAYDYINGRISTIEEISHRYTFNPKKNRETAGAERVIKDAKMAIVESNSNFQSRHRRKAAIIASNAFIMLFLANTGMNWSTLKQLTWGNNSRIGTDRQGFRTIKYRASGRIVSFEIQSVFLPTFKKYLKLREYLLNGINFEYLFLSRGKSYTDIQPLRDQTLKYVFKSLKRIDPNVPSIMSRQWRAGKSDWLLRNVDVSTAATILQNSEQTVLRSYSEGSPVTQLNEIGGFLERLKDVVLDKSNKEKKGKRNALGFCTSYENPNQIEKSPIYPDCHVPEGCLFCDKYKVHADEHDTRKLISCRYCLLQSSCIVDTDEQFQRLFKPVLSRIEELLIEIERREKGLVSRIQAEVDAGELDPYWAGKLEMLIELGLVA